MAGSSFSFREPFPSSATAPMQRAVADQSDGEDGERGVGGEDEHEVW